MYVQHLIVEAKVDDLKKKHPDLVDKIDSIATSIPAKYLEWAVKQLKSGQKQEDIVPTILLFDKKKGSLEKKDIFSYDLKTLEDVLKALPQKTKKGEKRDAKVNGARTVYEDDDVLMLRITSKAASVCYGAGTKWCITMSDAKYYEEYSSQGVCFYFIINKTLPPTAPMHKVAIALHHDLEEVEWFDARDRPIFVHTYGMSAAAAAREANAYRESYDKLLEIAKRDLETNPDIGTKIKKNNATSQDIAHAISIGSEEEQLAIIKPLLKWNRHSASEIEQRLIRDPEFLRPIIDAVTASSSPQVREKAIFLSPIQEGNLVWSETDAAIIKQVLDRLIDDPDETVRLNLVRMMYTATPEQQQKLFRDPDIYVRDAAVRDYINQISDNRNPITVDTELLVTLFDSEPDLKIRRMIGSAFGHQVYTGQELADVCVALRAMMAIEREKWKDNKLFHDLQQEIVDVKKAAQL